MNFQTKTPRQVFDHIAERCGDQAYKGYLIKFNALQSLYLVSKDGHHITSRDTLAAAKADIDQLV